MEGAGLSFSRRGIPVWDGLLQSAGTTYDTSGGGITILDSRTRDATGKGVVAFTSGHVAFRQSLLVRAEDAERLASHDDLTNDVRVGALSGTTGEFRLLELTGLVDSDGILTAGVSIDTPPRPGGCRRQPGLQNYRRWRVHQPCGETASPPAFGDHAPGGLSWGRDR